MTDHPLVRTAALKLLLPLAQIERDVRVHDLTQPELVSLVVSVLETIRDLTRDVAEVGADNLFGSAADDWTDDARQIWSAMINHILKGVE